MNRKSKITAALFLIGVLAAVASVSGSVASARQLKPAPAVAKADPVTDWNRTMVAGLEAAHVGPQPSSRIGAIVQTSVFDAVNGIERRYTAFHVAPDAPRGSSRAAAAASAAHTALVALIPSQQALFDQQLQTTLAQISNDPADPGQSVLRGLAWGQGVANAILAWRANDGLTAVLPPYVFGSAPGDYQPTPPLFGPPLFRQYATMTPWALKAPSQFLPPGPPPLTSARWAQDLAEVRAYGSAASAVRTAWQTETARFWQSDTPVAMWNRVAEDLAEAHHTTLSRNARVLALTNIAMADAMIATFNAKNTYDFWRPVTAIAATSDPTWSPLLATPAFQEYPSAHSTVSAAPATVLAEFYGNETAFTVTAANMAGVTRNFSSFTGAVQQIEDARVWAGFHYRFSCEDGAALGTNVGEWGIATVALPIHGKKTGQLFR
jgi:membrane-associated phospholipid phosphatase